MFGSILWLAGAFAPALALARTRRGLARLEASGAAGQAPPAGPDGAAPPPRRIWVLSAARDEAAALPAWWAALQAQASPPAPLAAVLVDDGSGDGGPAWARAQDGLVLLGASGEGKLAALQQGIEHALEHGDDGDAVLFTDADCRPAPDWAAAHVRALAAGFGLVAGAVELRPSGGGPTADRARRLESVLSDLQCGLGAATGRPAFVRGANWSTRLGWLRRTRGLAGREGQGSGDDLLLPARLLAAGAASAALAPGRGRVATDEDNGPQAARQRRRRRYSKAGALPPAARRRQLALAATLPLWSAALAASWQRPLELGAGLALAALLGLAALRLLRRGLVLHGERLHAGDLAALANLPLLGLAGLLRGGGHYEWKGRELDGPRQD